MLDVVVLFKVFAFTHDGNFSLRSFTLLTLLIKVHECDLVSENLLDLAAFTHAGNFSLRSYTPLTLFIKVHVCDLVSETLLDFNFVW